MYTFFFAKLFAKLATFLRYSRPTRNLNLIELTPSSLCPPPPPPLRVCPNSLPTPLRLSLRPPPCLLKFIPNTLPPSHSPPQFATIFNFQRGRGKEYTQLFGLPSRPHFYTPLPRSVNGGGG